MLRSDGLVLVRSMTLARALQTDAQGALRSALGLPVTRVECVPVTPVPGQKSIVDSNRDGRLHVDAHPLLSPQLVAMSCYEQSEHGGISFFADGWAALRALCADVPDAAPGLFLDARKFRYPAQSTYSPTFARRGDCFMFHHATSPAAGDDVGLLMHRYVDRQPRIALKLEPGDVYIIDNHRMLHGRTAFRGHRRLQRTQAWLAQALPTATAVASACDRARPWLEAAFATETRAVRRRLGLVPVSHESLDCSDEAVPDTEMDQVILRAPKPSSEVRASVLDALSQRNEVSIEGAIQ